jgi:hypothetical protein
MEKARKVRKLSFVARPLVGGSVPIPDMPPVHAQAVANFLPNGRAAGGFGRDPGNDRTSGTI